MENIESIKRIKIIQHNVRHWSTNKYSYYNSYREIDPDIILLNEHGMKNDEKIKIYGYEVHQKNKTDEMHDGVAIGIKTKYKYKILDNFIESTLAVKIQTELGDIVIGTIYQPPRRNYLPIEDILKLLNNTNPTYILADMNAKHRIYGDNRNNSVGTSLAELTNRGKLINLGPAFPTFIGHTTMTKIDKIHSNNKAFLNYDIEPGPITPSDHIPLILTLSTTPIQKEIKKERYQMHKANWTEFKNRLNNYQSRSLENEEIEIVDEEIVRIIKEIMNAMEKTIPKTRYKTLTTITSTEQIRRIKVQLEELKRDIYGNGIQINKLRRMKELQVQLQDYYRNQQKENWNKIIGKVNKITDPKEFWQKIRKLQGIEKTTSTYIIRPDGTKAYTDQEIEEQMREEWSNIFEITEEDNEHFSEDQEDIVKNYLSENIERITPSDTVNFEKLTTVGEITESEYYHQLRKFKERTPGKSGITRNVLLNLPANITNSLIKLYNAALSAGYFPDILKIAKMIKIPKEGKDSRRRENNRPISLLEVIGKVFEKTINTRLLQILTDGNKINKRHHGFRKQRGTTTALALVTEKIARAKRQRHQVNLILRDVSKAFDKVWHLGLQYKILQLGLQPVYEQILCDYVTDRKAYIQIGSYEGEEFDIKCGVPQGSCLSPTLYLIYTSDIPEPTPYSEHIMFADDITQLVIYPGKSTELMAQHTARAIENINQFEKDWKIKTNLNKFKVIPLAKKVPSPLIIEGDLMNYNTQGSMLGLKITTTGYTSHMKEKVGRANALLTKLQRFQNLSEKNKKQLYLSLVRSILEYPPIPIIALSKTQIESLQKIQNKALRFIYNIKWYEFKTNEELHRRAEFPRIEEILKQRAEDIWNKITDLDLLEFIENEDDDEQWERGRIHSWFPESKPRR